MGRLSQLLSSYDIVALQEVDGGSLRSGFVDQLAYLAEAADFYHFHQQLNRDWGQLGQFSNGLLSRVNPLSIENHMLPGVKGRGAIVARYGNPSNPLLVVGMHLALGKRAQQNQLRYIHDVVEAHEHVIVMGDLNCCGSELLDTHLVKGGLQIASYLEPTFPSWKPARNIDHILVSESLVVERVKVVDFRLSDHLPISVDVSVPTSILVH